MPQGDVAARPSVRPADPRFSSGPCKKHPGWSAGKFSDTHLGFSHRAPAHKAHIKSAIDRSAALLGLPEGWRLGIVPASDTGAFEMAMWSLLGPRGVDVLRWESFSSDWAGDIENQLRLQDVRYFQAGYGELPDLATVQPERDVVFVYNGTTSGVRVPNLDWLGEDRDGLAICDATSAVFAMPIEIDKLDVVTWSWQKVLGGEAGFGMLALSPRAVARLESHTPSWPMPKIFRLTKNGKLNEGIFQGSTINTPSMLAVDDVHLALDWAETVGGLDGLIARSEANYAALDRWVSQSNWIDWLPAREDTRSNTSMCLKITHSKFTALAEEKQRAAIKQMCGWLAEENVAYDIAAYRAAPPGLRIWGGATVDATDIDALVPWLDWAFDRWLIQD
ncbi:MAG: phosphoserine transaminase [Gammaproteobacteria bacterium]|nr:phosphoserine transaminase [Gammaproteobacteria bacterium]